MKKFAFLLLALLLMCGALYAQPGPAQAFYLGTPPGGGGAACNTVIGYLDSTGKIWTCVGGFWTQAGSGASGGGVSYCAPASASGSTYTCTPSPALSSYSAGTSLAFVPDVSGTGGATTVNVNGLGAKSIKESNGSSNPTANDLVAGQIYFLNYDGTNFRISPLPANLMNSCDISTGGSITATPTFNGTSCNGVVGRYHLFNNATTPLSTNVTSITLTALEPGWYVFQWYQGVGSSFTVTHPNPPWKQACTISPVTSTYTTETAFYDGTNMYVTGCTSSDTPSIAILSNRSAPGTNPTSGSYCWPDSTSNAYSCLDTSGNVYAQVMVAGGTSGVLNPPVLAPPAMLFANSATGTIANGLVVFSAAKTVQRSTGGATGGVIGICVTPSTVAGLSIGCGASSSFTLAAVATSGLVGCQFDANAITFNHYVQISATNGMCTDAGASQPASNEIIGIAADTCVASSVCRIWLNPTRY